MAGSRPASESSSAAILVDFARRRRLDRALERYRRDPYAMAVDCFSSYDPKEIPGRRLAKPWLHTPYHEAIFYRMASGGYDEMWIHKSKQDYGSWTCTGYPATQMILSGGYRAYGQSHAEEFSRDLVERVAYIFENLRGDLRDLFSPGDWELVGGEVLVKQVLGEKRESVWKALPSGARKWRTYAASYGLVDELAYHDRQQATYAAAKSACEGGGLLVLLSTGVFGTFFNNSVGEHIEMCQRHRMRQAVNE